MLLIVAVVLACSVGAYMLMLTRNFNRSISDEISAGREAIRLKAVERTQRAQLIARFAATDPDLRRIASLAADTKNSADIDFASVLARFRLIEPDADLLTIADADGLVLAQVEPQDPMAPGPRDRRGEPLFLNPLFQRASSGRSAAGVELCLPDVICIDAFEPILKESGKSRLVCSIEAIKKDINSKCIVGYVRVGFAIGDTFAREVKLATGTDLFLLRRDRGIASSLPPETFTPDTARLLADTAALSQAAPDRLNKSGEPGIKLGGIPYTLDTEKVSDAAGREIALRVIARSAAEVENARREAIKVLAAIAALGFALALSLSVFSVRRISKPLGELLGRVREITDGNLNVQIPEGRNDEIGELAGAFNEMTRSLSERDHLLRENSSELQRNQDQLIQSGKLAAIGELAAGIAHEIGNPLSAISGYAQMIQQKKHTPDQQSGFAKEIENEADFIERIIHDLLEFSRPSEKIMEPADPVALAEAALKTVSTHKAFNNIKIEKNFAPDIPPVPCYRKEIQQVFMNLIMNAAQAMPKGGAIWLDGERRLDCVKFRVRDNGPGVPANIRGKIFNPFFTTKPPGVGTGLGLAITYRIIEKHGGALKLEDSLSGACFSFTLPLESKK